MGLQGFRPVIGAVAVAEEGGLMAGGVRAHRDRGRIPGADPGALRDDRPGRPTGGPGVRPAGGDAGGAPSFITGGRG